MIKIAMKNGARNFIFWTKDEYDDYFYDGNYFIIIKNDEWVGLYNLDCIESIVIGKDK